MEQSTISGQIAFNRAMKPFALPLGLASPMWMAYGAAASVGATWWWMSRLSAFVGQSAAKAEVVSPRAAAEPVEAVMESPPVAPHPLSAPLEAAAELVAPVVEAPVAVEADSEPVFERPDELTLLRGVGPRVADALVAQGVTTFAQLAAWSEQDMEHFDKALKLLGRSKRYDFLGQARELAGL